MPKNVVPNPVYYTHTVYTYILKVCTSILLTQAATVNSSATQSYSTCDYISSHWAAISPPAEKQRRQFAVSSVVILLSFFYVWLLSEPGLSVQTEKKVLSPGVSIGVDIK